MRRLYMAISIKILRIPFSSVSLLENSDEGELIKIVIHDDHSISLGVIFAFVKTFLQSRFMHTQTNVKYSAALNH